MNIFGKKISISFKWQNIWVGAFIGKGTKYPKAVYVCIIPCFPIKFSWAN